MAAYHGRYEAAQILVERGALLHPKLLDGPTPLLLAAIREHLSVVRLLLDSRRGLAAPSESEAADSAAARALCRRAADLRLQWQDESNLAQAEALFREAIQEFPKHWEGHYGLGELLHLRANRSRAKSGPMIDEMIREIRRAAELAPDHVEPMLKLARVVAELDVESAEPLYRRAMDATIPGKPTLYEAGCQAGDHWEIGIEAAGRSGCEALCLEAFCRAIDFDPDYYGGFIMPASERARGIWSVALLVKPGGPPKPSENRSDPLLEQALREARADFDEMMNSHNQSVLLARRYQTTRSLADLEEALPLARRATQLPPRNRPALANLG